MRFHRPLPFAVALLCACTAGPPTGVDLGEFPAVGKDDAAVVVEVPFEVAGAKSGQPGELRGFTFRTCGRLAVTTEQDRDVSWERLQLSAESDDFRRRSWRGRAPYLKIPPSDGGCVEYSLSLSNWGRRVAHGVLRVETEPPPPDGVTVAFNQPDCEGCADPAGDLRGAVVDAVQSARRTLDLAMYGLDDPPVLEALCNAARAGVRVRAITDEVSGDADDSRSYHAAFFGPEGLEACGAEVELVRSYGLMHHKFLIVDAASASPLVVTGSANFTTAGLEQNHNHVVLVRGSAPLAAAFQGQFDQLFRHCASERLDGREATCQECSPACTEDHSENGPWGLVGSEISAFFSLGDDPLRQLRGDVVSEYREVTDPECVGDDAECVCRASGSRFVCDYCARGLDGWGLVGEAEERILMTMYSATDQCFALGLARAARRGVEVVTVWDFVKSGSKYSRDDYLCGQGVPTYVTNWGGGSAQVRNHNKTVVVDDAVFDGSLNLGDSGARINNENVLVIRDPATAEVFAEYVRGEVALLEARGVTPRPPESCRCFDLVDNDGDGLTDLRDPDCDDDGAAHP